jgi:hypothetical protein
MHYCVVCDKSEVQIACDLDSMCKIIFRGESEKKKKKCKKRKMAACEKIFIMKVINLFHCESPWSELEQSIIKVNSQILYNDAI